MNFRDVTIEHQHSFDALVQSAEDGCHFCNLLLTAWEQKCALVQDANGHWKGKLGFDRTALDGPIKLKFSRNHTQIKYTGAQVDEVQIAIMCKNTPAELAGQLICYPLNGQWYVPIVSLGI